MQGDITPVPAGESVSRTFWRFAVPSVAAMVVNGLYQVVDGMFVGHYVGYQGLAGINIAWPMIGLVAGLGIMVGMGAGSLISMFRGEGNNGNARKTLATSLWLVLLFGALSTLALGLFGDMVLSAQGAGGETLALGSQYIEVFTWGAVLTIAAASMPMLIRNDDSPNFATGLTMAGAVLNIVLDYLLIGVFDMALKGAAIATLISQLAVTIVALGYFFSGYSKIRLDPRRLMPDLALGARATTLGASGLFMFLYFGFIAAVHNRLLMSYGSAVHVGAFAMVGYIGTMYYLISEGIANGMQPPVSYYHGARQPEKIRATFSLALKVVLISGIATVAVLNIWPEAIIGMFSSGDPVLAEAAKTALRLHLAALFLDGFIFLASVWFMAVGQGGRALAVSAGNMLIQLPFLWLLPKWIGLNGIWLSVPLSNVVLTLIIAPVLWSEMRKLREGRFEAGSAEAAMEAR